MKKAYLLVAFAAFTTFGAMAQNRAVKFETGSFADVLAKAKKENKPIMMDAYTTWCGPCKMMDKQVFTNDTVADYFNANFIPFKSDMEKGEGKELAKQFEVRAYPNFVFISPDGSVLHRSVGARPPQAFVAVGKDALNPEKQFGTLQKKYAAGNRDSEFLASYVVAKGMAALDNSKEMNEYFALQKDADLLNRRNWNMIRNFADGTTSPAYTRFIKQRDAFAKTYTKDSVDQFILHVYEGELYQAMEKGTTQDLEKLKTGLTALKIKGSEKIIWTAEADAYRKKGDYKNYGAMVIKLVDNYYTRVPSLLNNYAWSFYEKVDDKTMLAKAEDWAGTAVKMDPSFANLDTQAAVLYKLGKKKEARTAAENAIAMGKKTGEDVSDTEKLLQKINTLK